MVINIWVCLWCTTFVILQGKQDLCLHETLKVVFCVAIWTRNITDTVCLVYQLYIRIPVRFEFLVGHWIQGKFLITYQFQSLRFCCALCQQNSKSNPKNTFSKNCSTDHICLIKNYFQRFRKLTLKMRNLQYSGALCKVCMTLMKKLFDKDSLVT